MPVKFQFLDPKLQTWLLCHQTYDSVYKCEEAIFSKEGLSTQQHAVLMAIKYIDGPVTISELAHWLERNPNGLSTMVYRMEKDGLLSRKRDLTDRRAVRLVITKKGKEKLERATVSAWKLIEELLSCLSHEEMRTLNGILERVRENAFRHQNPEASLEEIRTDDANNMRRFMTRVRNYDSDRET